MRPTSNLELLVPTRVAARWFGPDHVRKLACELWSFHPQAAYFITRGGDEIPPPLYANLALTNRCNLRCEICGSQKNLDQAGIIRRDMPLDLFEAVAATLFPVLTEVELNSQGDPLLYAHIERVIERINDHKCELRVQTNGTLFSDRITTLLQQAFGTVMLSLDAVGARFDEVRKGGVWEKAEPQLLKFLRSRDPRRLRVGLYPTVTRRTLQDMVNVVHFAADNSIESVFFHRYAPIANSFEEEPTPDELARAHEQLRAWLATNGDSVEVEVDGVRLNSSQWSPPRKQVASPTKQRLRALVEATGGRTYPMDADMSGANRRKLCSSPDRYVEIGLAGQMSVCCRAQDIALAYATSVEEFADAWFGTNYEKIRRSLDRDHDGPLPLPNCESCLRFFAPQAATRKALTYVGSDLDHPSALDLNSVRMWRIDMIQRYRGHSYAFRLQPGIDLGRYELWEDQTKLGPGGSPPLEISDSGLGRYAIVDRHLIFSSSDNSDARKNGRLYSLRRP